MPINTKNPTPTIDRLKLQISITTRENDHQGLTHLISQNEEKTLKPQIKQLQ